MFLDDDWAGHKPVRDSNALLSRKYRVSKASIGRLFKAESLSNFFIEVKFPFQSCVLQRDSFDIPLRRQRIVAKKRTHVGSVCLNGIGNKGWVRALRSRVFGGHLHYVRSTIELLKYSALFILQERACVYATRSSCQSSSVRDQIEFMITNVPDKKCGILFEIHIEASSLRCELRTWSVHLCVKWRVEETLEILQYR